MKRENGYVYFMRPYGMLSPVKIGWSNTPKNRLGELSKWSPFVLEIVATVPANMQLEQTLHECFAYAHLHHEWFSITAELHNGIIALRNGAPVEMAFDLTKKTGSLRKGKKSQSEHWTAASRQRTSFTHRLRHVAARLRRHAGDIYWPPEDVQNILDRTKKQTPLTSSEIETLERVLKDPAAHFITHAQRFPDGKARPAPSTEAAA